MHLQQTNFENIVTKRENAQNEHQLPLLPQCLKFFSVIIPSFLEKFCFLSRCFQSCPLKICCMWESVTYENIIEKEELTQDEQFLLLQQHFQLYSIITLSYFAKKSSLLITQQRRVNTAFLIITSDSTTPVILAVSVAVLSLALSFCRQQEKMRLTIAPIIIRPPTTGMMIHMSFFLSSLKKWYFFYIKIKWVFSSYQA